MVQRRFKHHRRYQEIINTFLKNGLSHLLFRLGLTERLFSRKEDPADWNENLTDIGVKLRNTLQALGPTFIKLGQIASSRRDLVPEEIALELEKLQDDVESASYEEIEQIIIKELGDSPERLFATFDRKPLATASIGQVHVATLHSGEEVAIKIQRPHIEPTMLTDLDILQNLARFLDARMSWARTYRIRDIIDEFSYSLKNELDYFLEGRNGERIASMFKDNDMIHVPKIFWKFTSRKVLTMEMVHGIKVNKYDRLEKEGFNKKFLAEQITDAMLVQILDYGFFHGDPHPGNIFIMPNHKIAFLDFGMVGYLSDELKYYFSSLIVHLYDGDTSGIIDIFEEWGLLEHVENYDHLKREIDRLHLRYYNVPLQQLSLGNIMLEIFSIAYDHQIDIPTDIAILSKVILTLESILEHLDPNLSIMKAVEPYGRKLMMERFHPLNVAKSSWRRLIENVEILSELPKDIKDLTTTMKKGRLQFDIQIFHLNDILNKLDRITNRLSFSIILLAFSILMVGLIIGAAIVGQTTLLWRIPVIEIGSIVATLMFLFMLFSIIRSGRM